MRDAAPAGHVPPPTAVVMRWLDAWPHRAGFGRRDNIRIDRTALWRGNTHAAYLLSTYLKTFRIRLRGIPLWLFFNTLFMVRAILRTGVYAYRPASLTWIPTP